MDQEEHNPLKSIIYGNQVKNPYGNFRAFCAAISHHGNLTQKSVEQIEKIITYLRTNQKFQRYNRFTYAFRVYEVQAFFVTQDQGKQPTENRMIEGYNEDQTLEGTGEKLLHLLQKFNVENVLIVSAIEQYNSLNKFETTHFRIIVERAKDLLNNLYTRVVQSEHEGSQQNNIVKFQAGSLLTRNIKLPVKMQTTKLEVPQLSQQPKFARSQDKQANRPNHFYQEGKPTFLARKSTVGTTGEIPPVSNARKIKELNAKLKNSAFSLEKILESLSDREYLQLKFIVKYDQNKLVEKVLCVLMVLTGVNSRDRLAHEYDFKAGLENITVNDLDDAKVRKINEILRGDKRLNVYTLADVNPLISTIFAFIMLLVKSYEAGKQLLKLTQSIQQTDDEPTEQVEQVE